MTGRRMEPRSVSTELLILGGGPAGLGVATEAARNGCRDFLLADRNSSLGGLSRTEIIDGNRFDIGPHRFFTSDQGIRNLWKETLGDDFRPVSRLTRIFYRRKLFRYPLEITDSLRQLGLRESVQAALSFLTSRGKPEPGGPATFEDWVTSRFGAKLYKTFFKTYTEKVWGIPCSRIGAEWAAQRIRNLDLKGVLYNALFKGATKAKTLVEEFDYPILGAGSMYERLWERLPPGSGTLALENEVKMVFHRDGRITGVLLEDRDGSHRTVSARHVFSSLPITRFCELLDPEIRADVRKAVQQLFFRDHITVNLVVSGGNPFPDQWIYIHSPEVRMARLANYSSFSSRMAAHPGSSVLGAEYFVFKGDDIASLPDDKIARLALDELQRMELIEPERVVGKWVVRETESYPTYFIGFQEPFDRVKEFLNGFENLTPIGRGGMYKYNNMDHSLLSGILAARNLFDPGSGGDLWNINIDEEYQEGSLRPGQGK